VPDFKAFTTPRSPDLPRLSEVRVNGEVPHVAIDEDGAGTSAVVNHAAQFTVSRQTIISCDLYPNGSVTTYGAVFEIFSWLMSRGGSEQGADEGIICGGGC
jgi:hypothetical protein